MSPDKLVAVLLLIALMFHTGLQVDREHLLAVLKNYGLLARAFLANFIIVPLLGVAIVRLFHLSEAIAIGVLLMAISPGVPFVVLSGGRKKGGSLGFAVSLAFLMPLVSIITVPITARLVLPSDAQISTNSLLVSLLGFQLVPLLLGIFAGDRAPALAERLGARWRSSSASWWWLCSCSSRGRSAARSCRSTARAECSRCFAWSCSRS